MVGTIRSLAANNYTYTLNYICVLLHYVNNYLAVTCVTLYINYVFIIYNNIMHVRIHVYIRAMFNDFSISQPCS